MWLELIYTYRKDKKKEEAKQYKYKVKAYEEGSEYGINGGKISKLIITRSGEVVASYDRGWIVRPLDEGAEIALAILIKERSAG